MNWKKKLSRSSMMHSMILLKSVRKYNRTTSQQKMLWRYEDKNNGVIPELNNTSYPINSPAAISVNLTAIIDGSIALPCDVTFPDENDAISLVLWFRGVSGVPIYSLDARNGSIYKASHFSDDVLGERVYFDLTSKPPLLKITPVNKEDEGVYECRVDYRRARTEKWRGHLRVIVPPRNVDTMDNKGKRVEGVIGPYNEGDVLSLSCEAGGNMPK
ncbi:uncharacterized protein LOC143233081 [Tachypleus tridentatus]|uniref:uncharacterized protein LOC143233081 n=1 Tax=Tachypleus tridentatus TaxID=6853 RepID=UPI003FD193D5